MQISSSFNFHARCSSPMEAASKKMEGTRINRVVLLLTALAFLLALGFWWMEGLWAALGTFAILLIVILLAAVPLKSRS
jgi:hypothetical protein